MGELVIAAFVAAGAMGCGRFEFEHHPITASNTELDGGADGRPDADVPPGCDPTADFGAPVLLGDVSDPTLGDGTLRLMPDELSGYYWSGNPPDQEIYLVTRPSFSAPFTRTLVQGINSATDELDPTLSSDGTVMVFRRNMPGDDLYVATRTAPDSFGAPAAIGTLNTASTEAQPFMPIGRDEVYFQSKRTMLGDVYVSARTGTTFSAPTLIASLATAAEEGDPVVTPDGLTIYFRTNRTAALAGFNIFVATRPTPTGTFGAATLVPNINTDSDDGPSWISPDGCRLYISSDIAGTNDVYVASRPLP